MKIEHKDRGWKIIQDNGEIVYLGEYGVLGANEGVIYKDYDAFYNGDENEVCYINEYGFDNEEENAYELFEFEKKEMCSSDLVNNSYQARTGYTRKDIVEMCNGDTKLAEIVFEECEWTCPETILDEMELEDFE